jgi:hypothetical protein
VAGCKARSPYRACMIDEHKIAERFADVGPELNERQRRLWAAGEARACGRGGIAAVARATGISEDTIGRGISELRSGERLEAGRVRRRGAGRPRLTESDPTLLKDLKALVDPDTRGDPTSPLRWSSKSLGKLRGRWWRSATRCLIGRWASCSRDWGFACTPITRRGRAPIILIATPSFATSAKPPRRRWRRASR